VPHLNREYNHYLEEAPVERLRLLGDRILCRVLKKPNRAGRFIIAGQWEYTLKLNMGRILKLGQDYTGNLSIGDYVIYETWTGREFQSPDETLILLQPQHILATIDRGEQ